MNASTEKQVSITGHTYAQVKTEKPQEVRRHPVVDATVYLGSAEGIDAKVPEQAVIVRVKEGRLEPEYSCVVVGQRFVVETADNALYAINITSPGEPKHGVIMPRDPQKTEKVFSKPHPCALITCNIHPALKGYVTVVPNAVFTRSKKDGSFQLPSALPPGKYELRAYHPQYGQAVSTFEIRPGDTTVSVDLILPPG